MSSRPAWTDDETPAFKNNYVVHLPMPVQGSADLCSPTRKFRVVFLPLVPCYARMLALPLEDAKSHFPSPCKGLTVQTLIEN